MKLAILAGCALASAMLSGCNTLGGGLTGGPAQAQFIDNLGKINAAAAKQCTGGGDFSWSPPLPPTGSMHLHCEIGQPAQLSPAVTAALAAAGFVPAGTQTPAAPAPLTAGDIGAAVGDAVRAAIATTPPPSPPK